MKKELEVSSIRLLEDKMDEERAESVFNKAS
jgi:hypothetical protein